MSEKKVVVVDDHALIRDAIESAIEREAGLVLVGCFDEARKAVEASWDLRPDVAVLDIEMPGMNAFEAARNLRIHNSDVRIVFLTAYPNDTYIQEAIELGADGFLTKTEPIGEILAALHAIVDGKRIYSPPVRERLDAAAWREDRPVQLPAHRLTKREREVLGYLARGLSRCSIGSTMCISRKTVDRHIENIMRKTNYHDRLDLARFAFREGFATP